jgi:hypothetical protein
MVTTQVRCRTSKRSVDSIALLCYTYTIKEDEAMKYEVTYNKVKNVWCVWSVGKYGAEIVKTFKRESAAREWIQRQVA